MIGTRSAYHRGLWNVVVYPEKGMMLRLRVEGPLTQRL
jgi:hypothetical protein